MIFDDYDVDDPEVENEHESESSYLSGQDDPEEYKYDDKESSLEDQGNTISFTGNGFDCTCSGKCLCRYYEPKSTYNSDCAYCGHGLHWHRRR